MELYFILLIALLILGHTRSVSQATALQLEWQWTITMIDCLEKFVNIRDLSHFEVVVQIIFIPDPEFFLITSITGQYY